MMAEASASVKRLPGLSMTRSKRSPATAMARVCVWRSPPRSSGVALGIGTETSILTGSPPRWSVCVMEHLRLSTAMERVCGALTFAALHRDGASTALHYPVQVPYDRDGQRKDADQLRRSKRPPDACWAPFKLSSSIFHHAQGCGSAAAVQEAPCEPARACARVGGTETQGRG